jgi:hypothetical protein
VDDLVAKPLLDRPAGNALIEPAVALLEELNHERRNVGGSW